MSDLNTRAYLTCFSALVVALIIAQPSLPQSNDLIQTKPNHAALVVSVTDEQGAAIDGVNVSVMEWTGSYKPYAPSPTIHREGRFYIDNLDIEKMFYLRVTADGFAPSMQSLLSLTAGETRSITFKLARPAAGWIDVVDPEGKPIAGAIVSALQYSDVNNNEVYITSETCDSLGFSFMPSDASGQLKLPPLPRNCKSSVTVIHPSWQVGKVNEAAIADGRMASLMLESGVRVECNLKHEGDEQDLEGKMAKVKMYSHTRSQTKPTDFIATVPILKNRIVFTASPVVYSQLTLELDSHILGPHLFNLPQSVDTRLDLTNEQARVFDFRALQKVKVKGRLIDSKGAGIANAYVSCSVAASETTPWQSQSKEKDRFAVARQWTSGGGSESDSATMKWS